MGFIHSLGVSLVFVNTIHCELGSLNGFLFRFRRKRRKTIKNKTTMKKTISEILKYCRPGLTLWSSTYGNACLEECTDSSIIVRTNHGKFITNAEGMLCSDGECVLFPSKEQRDWDKFWPYEDGDVLYAKDEENEFVFIYRKQNDTDVIGRYVNLFNFGELFLEPDGFVCSVSEIETIRYASENEIEELHTAIEEQGRIWNPVKKELENIEIVAAEEKKEKFDVNTLKPFDRVLVRDNDGQRWTGDLFLCKTDSSFCEGLHCLWNQCIPYEGNETLLATTKQPDEYYITWEE